MLKKLCKWQTITTLTALFLLVASSCFGQQQPFPGGGGGGGGGLNTLQASASGVKATGHFVNDAVINSSTTITSVTAHFLTQAKVGQVVWTINTTGASTGGLTTPYGTISTISNDTTIIVSLASNTNATGQFLMWGDDDTSALSTFWTSYLAGVPKGCGVLPSGIMITTSSQFTDGAATKYFANCLISNGYSILLMTPNFNWASCTVQSSCFLTSTSNAAMNPNYNVFENIEIWGGGYNFSGVNVGTATIVTHTADMARNIWLWQIGGANGGTLTGFQLNGPTVEFDPTVFGASGPGSFDCKTSTGTPGSVVLVNGFCGTLSASGTLDSTGMQYGGGGFNGSTVTCGAGATCNFTNDEIFGGTFALNNGGTSHLTSTWVFTNAASGEALLITGTGQVIAINSTITASGGGGVAIDRQNTSIFRNLGGNSITAGTLSSAVPTCAMTSGGGTGPACTLVAGSFNEVGTIRMTPGTTPAATGTTTLTFAGTFLGATGGNPRCTFNYANTGTGVWSLTTTTPIVLTTRSTTAPVFNWNQTGAIIAASTYDIDYVCQPS